MPGSRERIKARQLSALFRVDFHLGGALGQLGSQNSASRFTHPAVEIPDLVKLQCFGTVRLFAGETEYLFSISGNHVRRRNRNANVVFLNFQHRDDDFIANDNTIILTPGEYLHS